MSKNLTFANVNSEHKKVFKNRKTIDLNHGYKIQIDSIFQKTKIQKLVVDYQQLITKFNESDIDSDFVKNVTFIYFMLIIKYFSSLDNIPASIEGMVLTCEKLIDLELLDDIVSSFDESELKKVESALKSFAQNSDLYKEQISTLFAGTNLLHTDIEVIEEKNVPEDELRSN